MDGDFSPIGRICELAKKYEALTFLDEVHAGEFMETEVQELLKGIK